MPRRTPAARPLEPPASTNEEGQRTTRRYQPQGGSQPAIDNYDCRRIKTGERGLPGGAHKCVILFLFPRGKEHRSRAMIGVPGENGGGAVELLQEHDANKLMRPGRRTEGNSKACLLT